MTHPAPAPAAQLSTRSMSAPSGGLSDGAGGAGGTGIRSSGPSGGGAASSSAPQMAAACDASAPTFLWEGQGIEADKCMYYKAFKLSGVTYSQGDHVYLLPEVDGVPPYLARCAARASKGAGRVPWQRGVGVGLLDACSSRLGRGRGGASAKSARQQHQTAAGAVRPAFWVTSPGHPGSTPLAPRAGCSLPGRTPRRMVRMRTPRRIVRMSGCGSRCVVGTASLRSAAMQGLCRCAGGSRVAANPAGTSALQAAGRSVWRQRRAVQGS